jgi:hypothetical protein
MDRFEPCPAYQVRRHARRQGPAQGRPGSLVPASNSAWLKEDRTWCGGYRNRMKTLPLLTAEFCYVFGGCEKCPGRITIRELRRLIATATREFSTGKGIPTTANSFNTLTSLSTGEITARYLSAREYGHAGKSSGRVRGHVPEGRCRL